MWKVLNVIEGELYVAGFKKKQVADYWGVKPATVTKVFKGTNDISFGYLSKTLILLKKSLISQSKIVSEYITETDPKPENLREAMEDLALRGKFDLLKEIIDQEIISEVNENKEFAEVYEILYKRYHEGLKSSAYFELLRKKNKSVKTTEMEILIEILLCQAQYQSGNYKSLYKRLKTVNNKINDVTNKFIKECLLLRYKEAIAVTSLQGGEIDESRLTCRDILDELEWDKFFSLPKLNAYLKMGESLIFEPENYESAKCYLEKTLELLGNPTCKGLEKKLELVQQTLSFLKIHHQMDLDTLDFVHPSEEAYLMILQGDLLGAKKILLDLIEKNGELTDIQTAYYALTCEGKEKEDLLRKSLLMCQKSGNIHYSQLPKIHLGLL
ncbi:AimR family lysis-lysogeny pheromone receptor [Bacillus mycoides]|uniref:AimR family lysis-lysogeny pheromone receptor n=1 Tax=Bacillus mycoides TaxID=1405 RepID=UPI003F74BCB4